MKRRIRIIPKLDIKNGLLIKGINLEGLRIIGDPYMFAKYYYESGADEIYYHDNVATLYGTNNLSKFIKRTANNLYIPLTVGGGIKSIENIENALNNGADKVSINSAAVDNIKFINESAKKFGSSTITASIEIINYKNKYFISKSNGRDLVDINPVIWAKKLEDNGCGEIILTSVNNEGLRKGFDISIINEISKFLKVPVIAHGGAGTISDILKLVRSTDISAICLASMLHYSAVNYLPKLSTKVGNLDYLEKVKKIKKKENLINKIKIELRDNGYEIRK